MNDLQPGQLLDGRFTILELLTRGGWSSVFKAVDVTTSDFVVVKTPLPHVESDPAGYSRYRTEAAIGAALDHPGILKFIPIDESAKSRPYIVMEYLDGETLWDRLQDVGSFPPAAALCLGARVCDALEYLHGHHIIHRDLKPGNIMLCADGSFRIMDFGIARVAAARRLTFAGFSQRCGTPDYMAPEQVNGQRGDARTDVYGLGAMLYEMLTGHTPFDGESDFERMNARLIGDPIAPRKRDPRLTPEVEEIILHALARNPADRYASAAAMKADLEAPEHVAVTGRATRLQAPMRIKVWVRRARIAAVALLLPVLLFFVLLWLLKR
jgi:serine/threonine protein kinase